jgi:hypothetical protein
MGRSLKSTASTLGEHLMAVLDSEVCLPEERPALVTLMRLLAESGPPPDPIRLFPAYASLKDRLLEAIASSESEAIEEAFLTLYCHLHGHEAPYTKRERARLDATGGYWCHAGGISPILKAGPFIRPDTVSADFGAGNGLQGLLLQKLYPHRKTVQVEISSEMVRAGKALRQWLGIPEERVTWIVGDVLDYPPTGMDFIYLYRPVRPDGEGGRFYEQLARHLENVQREIVIFSIADCLGPFLGKRFSAIYSDGHLTCFRKGDSRGVGVPDHRGPAKSPKPALSDQQ